MSTTLQGFSEQQENLFQEMVSWVEEQGSEYARVHYLTNSDGEIINVWCEKIESGEEVTLPVQYWDIATAN